MRKTSSLYLIQIFRKIENYYKFKYEIKKYICHFNSSQHLSHPRITSVLEADYFCSLVLKWRVSFVYSSARVIVSRFFIIQQRQVSLTTAITTIIRRDFNFTSTWYNVGRIASALLKITGIIRDVHSRHLP